jgi:23S rRNA pseudouridine1911/1915/1917 synthase
VTRQKFFQEGVVPETLAGLRLDQVAAAIFPDFSRARLQQWIKDGALTVDGNIMKNKEKVFGGECLRLAAELDVETGDHAAESLPLRVVHEDDAILVIDKPVGMVVHPAAGNRDGTLLNALLHHFPDQDKLPRAGIVHRLDKDTSGLMVVARTLPAHRSLVEQLQERTLSRQYLALVQGVITAGGTIDAPMGRHPVHRTRRAVVRTGAGKQAITHYRVEKRFRSHTLVSVRLETGRTHQIRVHMAHIGYPLVGDQAYGGRLRLPRGASQALAACLNGFRRQALHAWRLGLVHPESDEFEEWEAPMPADFGELLDILEKDSD